MEAGKLIFVVTGLETVRFQWRMANAASCGAIGYEVEPAARLALNSAVGGGLRDYFKTKEDFCAHPQLRSYLLRNDYYVHRCDAVRHTQVFSKACVSFTATAPPPYEVSNRLLCFVTCEFPHSCIRSLSCTCRTSTPRH
jgi:hypothetical protein